MTHENFDRIGIGIKNALVTVASLMPNDRAMLDRAIASNTVACTVARSIATELGRLHPEMNLADFVAECAMELGSDGVWRVPPNSVYVSTYPL